MTMADHPGYPGHPGHPGLPGHLGNPVLITESVLPNTSPFRDSRTLKNYDVAFKNPSLSASPLCLWR